MTTPPIESKILMPATIPEAAVLNLLDNTEKPEAELKEAIEVETDYAIVDSPSDRTPCNWNLTILASGEIVANNSESRESFVGTVLEFNEFLR